MVKLPEDTTELSEEEAAEKFSQLLDEVVSAESIARAKHNQGDISDVEMATVGRNVSNVIDGLVLEGMASEKIAKSLISKLEEKIKEGVGNPLVYVHLGQVLAYEHEIEIGEKDAKQEDCAKSFRKLQEHLVLEEMPDKWEEMKEEAKKKISKYNNQMFA